MRAITMIAAGPPDVLTWGSAPDPEPTAGEVQIAVAASAVNRADLMQRQGFYPPPPGASELLGLECSGTITALGSGVHGWSVGDEVCALLTGGGYAELVTAPAGQVLPAPPGMSLVEAAGLPEVACTLWSNLIDVAGLVAGEVLLLHGGASGIGTFGIQYASAIGATVAVTAGSPEKLARCRALGATITVNYREDDFVEAVRSATSGHGADVVLDTIGAKYLARNVEVLATGGRVVTIGLQGGRVGELDLGLLLAKRGSVHATSLRFRSPEQKARIVAAVVAEVWPLIAAGRITPVVDRVLPMAEAAEAHRVLEASAHVGKVLLAV